ncbi:MAG TPA: hypothetical protein VK843_13820 [Planctomycetota bacterium]|nr:hypothetical protein [Planctomycetota bacterium]
MDERGAEASFPVLVAIAHATANFFEDEHDLACQESLKKIPGTCGLVLREVIRAQKSEIGRQDFEDVDRLKQEEREALTRAVVELLPRLDEQGRLTAYATLGSIALDPVGLAESWLASEEEVIRLRGVQMLLSTANVAKSLPALQARLATGCSEVELCWIAIALGSELPACIETLRPLLLDESTLVRRTAIGAVSSAIPPWACIDSVPQSPYYEWEAPAIPAWVLDLRSDDANPLAEAILKSLHDQDDVIRILSLKCILKAGMRSARVLSALDESAEGATSFEDAWRTAAISGLSANPESIGRRLLADAKLAREKIAKPIDEKECATAWQLLSLHDGWPTKDSSMAGNGVIGEAWRRRTAVMVLVRELAAVDSLGKETRFHGVTLEQARDHLAQGAIDFGSKLIGQDRTNFEMHSGNVLVLQSAAVPLLTSEWLATQSVFLGDWQGIVWTEYGSMLHKLGLPAAGALAIGIEVPFPYAAESIVQQWHDTAGLRTLLDPTLPQIWQSQVLPLNLLEQGICNPWEDWSNPREGKAATPGWIARMYGGLGLEALPILLPGLDSCVALVRSRSCEAISNLGLLPDEVLNRLVALLDDPEPRVQFAAAKALLRGTRDETMVNRARVVLSKL